MEQQSDFSWHELKTRDGYNLAECASALQKSIRRSLTDDALYWANQLYASGYEGYAWKRLFVILTEDICPSSNPGLVSDIWSLFQISEYFKKKAGKGKPAEVQTLGMTQAIIKMSESIKSRRGVHATIVHFQMPTDGREMPDYALDRHTVKGKQMKRSWDFFFEIASILINPTGEQVASDEYQESVRDWLNRGAPKPRTADSPRNLFE